MIPSDSERQEALHDCVVPRLGASLPQKLQYYKYLRRDHMFALTGRAGNGFAEAERRWHGFLESAD